MDGAANVYFGVSVGIAGNGATAAVGASTDDDKGSARGSPYVFAFSAGEWSQVTKLTAIDGELYGYLALLSPLLAMEVMLS